MRFLTQARVGRFLAILILGLSSLIAFSCALPNEVESSERPKNVILFIGDGMGFEQVKAGSYYLTGEEGSLVFEAFPYTADVMTDSASILVTDSAAAATAYATGIEVDNGVLSLQIPGDGGEIETLLELSVRLGKATGLVTTTYMTHATPAAFGAHEASRSNLDEIAVDYLYQTKPDVLFGGGGNGLTVMAAEAAGYTVVTSADELSAYPIAELPVSGQFGDTNLPYEYDGLGDLPGLTEMISKAIEILSHDPDGFFLMAEGGRIDHACHANDAVRAVFEVAEFSDAVAWAAEWADSGTDTLIIVTADHETGGLSVVRGNGVEQIPDVEWTTGGHTGVDVPLYATGPGAKLFGGVIDNTRVHQVLASLLDTEME